jgi:aldehyde dehydrogenase (NAD+)
MDAQGGSMAHEKEFFIDGRWQMPDSAALIDVINPATEQPCAQIACGNARDIDKAVAAARAAFPSYSQTTRAQRIELLRNLLAAFERNLEPLSQAMSIEMGVPIHAARTVHFPSGPGHIKEILRVLETYPFDEQRGNTLITKEAIGVCGLITPWNFPINQLVCKIAPALAAGCTMVLKPSEVSPLSALLIADILHEAGVPAGVFNLVNGDGVTTGHALTAHPDVDMISFTGSTRAGVQIAKTAADTVKRVGQELGGKSANVLLSDVDFERAVTLGVNRCFNNSGQSCVSPTRMLVPADRMEEVLAIAARVADGIKVGVPEDESSVLGPVANRNQFDKIQKLIQTGIDQGARLVAGGPGRPQGLDRGFYVRPTVFGQVTADMAIAQEEIFGPVLSIMGYQDEDDAVRLANDTPYGLAAYVQGKDIERARVVARKMRAGNVQLNYPPVDRGAPFGGYKQSGNGREWGEFGLAEYLEIKGVVGYGPPQ